MQIWLIEETLKTSLRLDIWANMWRKKSLFGYTLLYFKFKLLQRGWEVKQSGQVNYWDSIYVCLVNKCKRGMPWQSTRLSWGRTFVSKLCDTFPSCTKKWVTAKIGDLRSFSFFTHLSLLGSKICRHLLTFSYTLVSRRISWRLVHLFQGTSTITDFFRIVFHLKW